MKTYIVKYTEHYFQFYPQENEINIFKTNDEIYAKNYVKKFNRILEKARQHIEYMRSSGIVDVYVPRWHIKISDTGECYYIDCICQNIKTRP